MESVLKKTIASLETALKYNPDNVELMTSLAEGYIRMGKLDADTIALCDKVLAKGPGKPMLENAQMVAMTIEQVNLIIEGLNAGGTPPAPDAIESPTQELADFLRNAQDCGAVWSAWVSLKFLAGKFENANNGLQRLAGLNYPKMNEVRSVLDWIGRKQSPELVDWLGLYKAYQTLGDQEAGIRALERSFDKAISKATVGPILLENYLSRFTIDQAAQVPEAMRPRFFQLLVDYGDSGVTGQWLQKASLNGWQVSAHSKAYARTLLQNEQLDAAFDILKGMPMDDEVRELLNQLASSYEENDELDEAVSVLRFINSDEHQNKSDGDDGLPPANQELELNRNMELSLAELHLKNNRFTDALVKYVSALCIFDRIDNGILERIDEIIDGGYEIDTDAILKLAVYFRRHQDPGRAIHYINLVLQTNPRDLEALHELEAIYDELIENNPTEPELHLQRGALYYRMGRLEEAQSELNRAAAHPEFTEEANRILASTHLDQGHLREALKRFQHIRLSEADLDEVYRLQEELAKVGDGTAAYQALQLIRDIRPDYRDVMERMRDMENRGSHMSSSDQGPPGIGETSAPYPAAPEDEADIRMKELIGDLAIGRYTYVDKIGSGGMGVVYKVEDVRSNRFAAMKILRDGLASSSKALDRFFREARIAGQIKHQNIVEMYDYNISSRDGENYIVMEYIEGQSLREFVDLHFDNTISTSIDYITEILFYGVQLFDALQATHDKGIIHRDIKPDNIMVTSAGLVKVTDFGIVHVEEATFTPSGAMLGTPRYMAPEQVSGLRVDGRSDIYSVGILLYEVLTGSPPFMTGDISYQQVNKAPVEPRLINSVIPQSVNSFILKCLEKKPENRFSDSNEAKLALAEILESLGGCKKYQSRIWVDDETAARANGGGGGPGRSLRSSQPTERSTQAAITEPPTAPDSQASPPPAPAPSAAKSGARRGAPGGAVLDDLPGEDLEGLDLDDLDLDLPQDGH